MIMDENNRISEINPLALNIEPPKEEEETKTKFTITMDWDGDEIVSADTDSDIVFDSSYKLLQLSTVLMVIASDLQNKIIEEEKKSKSEDDVG